MNIEQARFNMVEQQIRPWDVLDTRVLDLLFEVRREDFVPESLKRLAFADVELPMQPKGSLLSPKMEARLVQELKLQPEDRVLQVGVANGYIAALVSKLAKSVVAVESDPIIADNARKLLAVQPYPVEVITGDAAIDWSDGGPWDAILVTGSMPNDPSGLIGRLAEGGRLVAVVGDAPVMRVIRFTREAAGVRRESLFETIVPPLKNAPQPKRFSF